MGNNNRTIRRAKFFPKVPKNSGLVKDKHAPEIFIRKIGDFKNRRKYEYFMPRPEIILRGRTKKAFLDIVDSLESLRLYVGMGTNGFYKLISEFILIPSERKYYPLKMIFTEEENEASEEFLRRIFRTLTWIADLTGRNYNEEKIVNQVKGFAKELTERKISIPEMPTLYKQFRTKNWFCIVAIMEVGRKKGWTQTELLERIRIFYKRKIKKVTVEMVLADLTHGDLDRLDLWSSSQKKPTRKKVKHYKEVIEDDDWYKDWEEGLSK